MEELIKQAFQSVEVIGPQVQRGQFDLIGPNGEIILPQVWEKVVEPDWQITMVMWPLADKPGPRAPPDHPGVRFHRNSTSAMPGGGHGGHRGAGGYPVPPAVPRPPAGGGSIPPPPPPDWHGGPPRPPNVKTGVGNGGVEVVAFGKKDRPKKSGNSSSAFLGWMSGTQKKPVKK